MEDNNILEELIATADDNIIEVNMPESEGSSTVAGVIAGSVGTLLVGAAALAVKNRNKIKQRNIERKKKKLEKLGYEVIEPVAEESEVEEPTEETEDK